MSKERMTIHRALSELKLMDKKIEKSINELEPTGRKTKDGLVNDLYEKEQFTESVRAKFQSVNDLFTRKALIKNAILESNSKTKVKIAGEEMTVTDAITKKSNIDLLEHFVTAMELKHKNVMKVLNTNNEKVERNSIMLAQSALSKEGITIGDDDANAIIQPYLDKNKWSLVDPVNIEDWIEKKKEYILNFKSEVDSCLSESNALTFIEI